MLGLLSSCIRILGTEWEYLLSVPLEARLSVPQGSDCSYWSWPRQLSLQLQLSCWYLLHQLPLSRWVLKSLQDRMPGLSRLSPRIAHSMNGTSKSSLDAVPASAARLSAMSAGAARPSRSAGAARLSAMSAGAARPSRSAGAASLGTESAGRIVLDGLNGIPCPNTSGVSESVLAEYIPLPWTPPIQLLLFVVHPRRLRSYLPLRLTEPRLSLSRKRKLHRPAARLTCQLLFVGCPAARLTCQRGSKPLQASP